MSDWVCTHYIFVYINIVNAVFTCFLSGWPAAGRESLRRTSRCFCKASYGSWFSEILSFTQEKRLQPELLTPLPISFINLNKCNKCKKKSVLLLWIDTRTRLSERWTTPLTSEETQTPPRLGSADSQTENKKVLFLITGCLHYPQCNVTADSG